MYSRIEVLSSAIVRGYIYTSTENFHYSARFFLCFKLIFDKDILYARNVLHLWLGLYEPMALWSHSFWIYVYVGLAVVANCLVYFIPVENTTTVFGTARKDSYGDTVVLFMTAIYLLVVNILLLNLLIAIFK